MRLANLPRYTTTAALSQLAGVHHGVIQRLCSLELIAPVAILEEKSREILLFDPASAALVRELQDRATPPTTSITIIE